MHCVSIPTFVAYFNSSPWIIATVQKWRPRHLQPTQAQLLRKAVLFHIQGDSTPTPLWLVYSKIRGTSLAYYLWVSSIQRSTILKAHPCTDGGGIRGFSSLIILRELMQHVRDVETRHLSEEDKKMHSSYDPDEYIPCIRNCHDEDNSTDNAEGSKECGECCRYIPAHYFDYIGGTSTGGLIAIMLGRLRMSVQDCMEEYERLSGDIFGHPRLASVRGPIPYWRDKYDGEKIQRAVEDVIKRRMSPEERIAGAGSFNSPRGLCRT